MKLKYTTERNNGGCLVVNIIAAEKPQQFESSSNEDCLTWVEFTLNLPE